MYFSPHQAFSSATHGRRPGGEQAACPEWEYHKASELLRGPWSDQNTSGTPVRQKDCLNAEMRANDVVLCPIGIMSGQSV